MSTLDEHFAANFCRAETARARVVRIDVPSPLAPLGLADCTIAQWCDAVGHVLGETIEAAQEAVLELLGEGGGSVLFVVPAVSGDAAWRTGVAGLRGLTRSIAKEYGRQKIRCNMLVGEAPDLERMLATNECITGEMLVASPTSWAIGLE